MATVRHGNQGVLVVVDVQVGVMEEAWDSQRIVHNVARAVERARGGGVPVVWVQHADEEDAATAAPSGSGCPSSSRPEASRSSTRTSTRRSSRTELDEVLGKLGATHIVLAGAATNWCIRATAYGALDRGYDLTLIEDAHTTGTMELGRGTKIEARTS